MPPKGIGPSFLAGLIPVVFALAVTACGDEERNLGLSSQMLRASGSHAVLLSSESGGKDPARMSRLKCVLPNQTS